MNQTPTDLDQLFSGAQPRPRPTSQERTAAFESVHAHWQKTTVRRTSLRRRSMAIGGLLAACLMITLGLFWQQPQPGAPVTVATIERIHGDVLVNSGDNAVWRPLTRGTFELTANTQLRTLDGALRVRTQAGGSMRIDANTVVTFLSDDHASMDQGRLYFDSGAHNARTLISTPLGTVRNLGTQFSVQLDDNALTIAVRSGKTVLQSKRRDDATTHAGKRRIVYADGAAPQLEDLSTDTSQWVWADALGAKFALEGRSAQDYIDWVEQETGRPVRFASDQAQARAANLLSAGNAVVDASPTTIQAILSTVGLQVEQKDVVLVISLNRQ